MRNPKRALLTVPNGEAVTWPRDDDDFDCHDYDELYLDDNRSVLDIEIDENTEDL